MPQRREVTQFNGPAVRQLLQLVGCIHRARREFPNKFDSKVVLEAARMTAMDEFGWTAERTDWGLRVVADAIKTGQLDRLANAHKVVVYDDGSCLIQEFTGRPLATRP